jgi:hypothetical protein
MIVFEFSMNTFPLFLFTRQKRQSQYSLSHWQIMADCHSHVTFPYEVFVHAWVLVMIAGGMMFAKIQPYLMVFPCLILAECYLAWWGTMMYFMDPHSLEDQHAFMMGYLMFMCTIPFMSIGWYVMLVCHTSRKARNRQGQHQHALKF